MQITPDTGTRATNAQQGRRAFAARYRTPLLLVGAFAVLSLVVLSACAPVKSTELDPELVKQGKQIFRYDTFGDETKWTDQLGMNAVIEAAVSPVVALSVGLKVDSEALPAEVVEAIAGGLVDLTDPQTTLTLIKLNAVVGIQGDVETADDGVMTLTRVGITCALCHSTVDDSASTALGINGGKGIGKRLDGWPNRDLNAGAIIALSPVWDTNPDARTMLNSWGPGMYDPRFNFDGKSNPTVIPPAYGLFGLENSIFTGDGDVQHEPAGPVAYWNRYVSVTQMGGHGVFSDPRLPWTVDNTDGGNLPDLVTSKLPALQAYQWSISAPAAPEGSFDVDAAARGKVVFNSSAATCATCHTGELFTDATEGVLHPITASAAAETDYALRSATKQWRTSPLKGLWQHAPYFHDGSAATLEEVVDAYVAKLGLTLSEGQASDLVEFLKSL